MNKDRHSFLKEMKMIYLLIFLIAVFIYLLTKMNVNIKNEKYNQEVAALSKKEEIKIPDYNGIEFISKTQFLYYQIGVVNKMVNYCEISKSILDVGENIDCKSNILVDNVYKNQFIEDENCYVKIHIIVKNLSENASLFKIKPICQIMLDEGIYNDNLNDKFELVDMKFDTDIEGYTVSNIDVNNKISSDMGYVRTDDWKSFAFRVYIESNSEISYTCVFRTPKEYADDENLVIGNDDSHASRRWDGEKEVTYDNGGYRIYINRQ